MEAAGIEAASVGAVEDSGRTRTYQALTRPELLGLRHTLLTVHGVESSHGLIRRLELQAH